MKEYKVCIKGIEIIVYQDDDGQFIIPDEFKELEKVGTALKPAYEPIIIARKPCEGSCVDNVLKYGVGGINIEECRIGTEERTYKGAGASPQKLDNHEYGDTGVGMLDGKGKDMEFTVNGRYPANVILTYDENDKEKVIGGMPYTKSNGGTTTMPDFKDAGIKNVANGGMNKIGYNVGETAIRKESSYIAPTDDGSAARYFYTAKASNRDRDEGLDCFEVGQCTGGGGGIGDYLTDVNSCSGKFGSEKAPHRNTHPCVKPCDLMQYLVRLVTPKGGTVLDPFNGSGSTGKAVAYENFDRDADYKYIGIELSNEYLSISDARIRFVENKPKQFKLF
ncbi:MAG: site-specific DNA-methyltransferase [Bacteroidales bacterium]|nr:site-specific DNA-methyltransferase [Bacteroidales bacterium]